MDKSVERYRARRRKRLDGRIDTPRDSVAEYRRRRDARVRRYNADASARLAYGIAKGLGINTEGMAPQEVWEAIKEKDPGAYAEAHSSKKRSGGNKEGFDKNGGIAGWKAPKVKGMDSKEVHAVLSGCDKVAGGHYSKATEVAQKKPVLRTFTTHGMDHIQQVIDKTNQAADAVERLNGPKFKGAKLDRKLMLVSAYFHDTGMDGGDADWSADDGAGIRGNHGVGSALHILEHAKEIEAMGVNPAQAAFVAFAHTKSKSGINDLMSADDWKVGLDKLEKAVQDYNDRNPDKKIAFDRDSIFDGEPTEDNISHIASQVAAIRLGDANREANIPLRSQTGGKYVVKQMPDPKDCVSKAEEARLAKISIDDDTGSHDLDEDEEYFDGLDLSSRHFSKGVVLGERNMVQVDAVYNEKYEELQENVTLKSGNAVPWSTAEALLERCGELNTINGVPRAMVIKIPDAGSWDELSENAKNAYRDMWGTILTKKKNGKLVYEGIDDVVFDFGGERHSMAKSTNTVRRERNRNGV